MLISRVIVEFLTSQKLHKCRQNRKKSSADLYEEIYEG
jgi:hypothetical protein